MSHGIPMKIGKGHSLVNYDLTLAPRTEPVDVQNSLHQETVFAASPVVPMKKHNMFMYTEERGHDLRFRIREAVSDSNEGHMVIEKQHI